MAARSRVICETRSISLALFLAKHLQSSGVRVTQRPPLIQVGIPGLPGIPDKKAYFLVNHERVAEWALQRAHAGVPLNIVQRIGDCDLLEVAGDEVHDVWAAFAISPYNPLVVDASFFSFRLAQQLASYAARRFTPVLSVHIRT